MKQAFKRIVALAMSAMMLLGCVAAAEGTSFTYDQTIAWDAAYDVVVIGFGGAGAVAAKNAADAGANVLILEKAPEGGEGGNTRFAGQMFAYGHENYEATLAYFKALGGSHAAPDAMLEVYCKNIANMKDVVAEEFGLDQADFVEAGATSPYIAPFSPEYPELPGSESVELWAAHDGTSDGYLWQVMRGAIVDRSASVDVWFESPAMHLIQDPQSKTIVGVQVQRGGEMLNVRAHNGVVMATGGFENNDEMVETFLGLGEHVVLGSMYNTGDGVRMAMEVGADLWHMEVYEGMGFGVGSAGLIPPEGQQGNAGLGYMPPAVSGSAMLVSGSGERFLDETEPTRHGHIKNGDVYANPWYPQNMYLVLGAQNAQALIQYQVLSEDYPYLYVEDTIEALAEAAGMDAQGLKATVEQFNSYAQQGADPQFGRPGESMAAFAAEGPYYAAKVAPLILNTQGGARRNENAEVLDVNGKPIPHLYSAGEFCGICSLQYQGGGNIAECIIFGSIAGKNAAAQKEPLPAFVTPTVVESTPAYTIGVQNDLIKPETVVELGENEFYGEASGMGGTLGVKVTLDAGVIKAVEVLSQNETAGIADPALEQIPARIVEANSADVEVCSGATITSKAIIEAVKAALAK